MRALTVFRQIAYEQQEIQAVPPDPAAPTMREQNSQAREPQGWCCGTFPVSHTDGAQHPGLCQQSPALKGSCKMPVSGLLVVQLEVQGLPLTREALMEIGPLSWACLFSV